MFSKIEEKSDNPIVIYLSTYIYDEKRYLFYTFIDLKEKIVLKDLGASCESCSKT